MIIMVYHEIFSSYYSEDASEIESKTAHPHEYEALSCRDNLSCI